MSGIVSLLTHSRLVMPWMHTRTWLAVLVLTILSLSVRIPLVYSRSAYFDEAITLLEVSGHAGAHWPDTPRPAGELAILMRSSAPLAAVTKGVYTSDVHPPLYYILLALWRRLWGYSLISARALSVLASTVTIILAYGLSRLAGLRVPFIPAALCALSTGAVWSSTVARNYAVASSILYGAVLFAWIATRTSDPRRQITCGVASALLCGLVIHTHYLAAFPVAAVLMWWFAVVWRRSHLLALAVPALAFAIAAAGLQPMLIQSGTRAHQGAGYLGFRTDIGLALSSLVSNTVDGFTFSTPLRRFVYIIISILAFRTVLSILLDRTRWGFWVLIAGLALFPTLGMLATDYIAGKNLAFANNYHVLAVPAVLIAISASVHSSTKVAFTQGPGELALQLRRIDSPSLLTILLCGALAILMLASLAWGQDMLPDWPGDSNRTIAHRVAELVPDDSIIVLGGGWGRSDPAAFVLELEPEMHVLVLKYGTEPQHLTESLVPYAHVCLLPARDGRTAADEQGLIDHLIQNREYALSYQDPRLVCLHRSGDVR